MKNILVILLFIGISAFNPNYINGSDIDNVNFLTKESSDTVVVNFEYGENISPTATWKNIYAVWMEDTTSNFIQNIFICTKLVIGSLTGTVLPYWKINKYPISSGSEVDAVTGATKANTNFSVSAILKDSNIRKFDLFFEVDRSFEPNDWFSDQPALLYSIHVNLDDTTTNYELIPIGWTPNESTQNKIPNTPIGKLQKEMKYITNHKVGLSFGDADERSATKMVKKITALLKKPTTTNLVNQPINFTTGWNLMSMNIIPDNKNLMTIFQSLIDTRILQKVMDESGNSIDDWGIFGGWQNGIGEINPARGYKVKVNGNANLMVSGSPVIRPFAISLKTGWNIIGYPNEVNCNAMNVVQPLIDNGTLVKVQDEGGNSIEDWGIFGGWTNNIGNFAPGEGYKIRVNANDTLWIYDTCSKSNYVFPQLVATTHFLPHFIGNGVDHMNINLVNLAESGIMEGDEIGIFDRDICVGSAQISDLQSLIVNQRSISIPVSAADGIEDKNGYFEGNPIILKLYRNGKEYPLTIEPLINSTPVFEKGSSLFAKLALPTGIEGIINGRITGVKVYPNPFSDEVNVEINLVADAQVQVEVLNQLGQKVKMISTKQLLPDGLYKHTWNGKNTTNGLVAPGIYHLRIEINDLVIHKKIVFSK